jgi:UMF1 family MFS transporter
MAGFFPVFFNQFWSIGVDTTVSTARLGMTNAIAAILVALSAPILGAMADRGAAIKKFLLFFIGLGVSMTLSLFWMAEGWWLPALMLYALATLGFSGGNIFYDALLPTVAPPHQIDFISALGFSLGYLGGGLLFALNVAGTLFPEFFGFQDTISAVRFSFLMTGAWWGLFSIPLFRFVPEPATRHLSSTTQMIQGGWCQFMETFRQIRHHKPVFLFLCAYWLYIDGVHTVIRMAVDYGLSIGLHSKDLVLALLLTQFIGFPAALGFGRLAMKSGTRNAILTAIGIYLFISLWGACLHHRFEFYLLAGLVGLVQGGLQSLSRSYYAKIIPSDKTAEYFGFYNMIGKFAAILGPVMMGGVGLWMRPMHYSSDIATRAGIAAVSLLFISGGLMFHFVSRKFEI